MKTSITDRIFEVLKQTEVKDSQLSRTLGVSRTTISEWRMGKLEPSARLILKFLFHSPEVDANWLIRGTGQNENQRQKLVISGKNQNTNQAGGNISTTIDNNHLLTENKYLKEIISEKDKQIKLLEQLIK